MIADKHPYLLDALAAIDPATLDYQTWVDMGMALHESGYSWQDWEDWSRRDPARFHEGECAAKWRSFGNGSDRVGSGTIIHLAEQRGWRQPTSGMGSALDWDGMGTATSGPDVTAADVETIMDADVGDWDQCRMLGDYLGALFEDDDLVCYVTEVWERDGDLKPTKGHFDRTAGQLREELAKTDSLDKVLGDWDVRAGAWVCFNPLDGKGRNNTNVTEYRYALVESDVLELDKQLPAIKELNLPCAAVVSSAGKSVHAIVRVDAGNDAREYAKRVQWLYDYCDRHGFVVDRSNKNAARLSRLPGVTRNERRQLLLATNIGPDSWESWRKWAEESEDDLPDEDNLMDLMLDPPPLADELIEGVLRVGHKMLLAGPSKAGKSFLLMQLAMAVASGRTWLGRQCRQGKVLYVNLEIDRASITDRFRKIAKDQPSWFGDQAAWSKNISVWTLRGYATTLDKLTPKLIRRGRGKGYSLVIVDPIYKVITGDENSASEMSLFCNHFDMISQTLGCAVAYCHHFSKGDQGGKRAIDRASGSGVFARDPDAQLTMTPIEVDEQRAKQLESTTCWRIEYTLREFESPKPTDMYFRYPVHILDANGELAKYELEGADPERRRREAREKARKKKVDEDRQAKILAITDALMDCAADDVTPTIDNIVERMGSVGKVENVTKRHIKDWCNPERAGDWTPFRIESVKGVKDVVVDIREDNN
ncbi:MAG: AAA family ATPase [Atopobiaceae bacterium]|nr:AAA family ATPase [Atopobiaceae bacterium]